MTSATERTLLFTDIEGSTQLVERLGDAAATDLWKRHDRAARDLLQMHSGREIDRSDGFFMIFERVHDAANFALGYHAALAGLALKARVALHVGVVQLRENLAADVAQGAKPIEVEGLAKPFAARLMALAQGGQTLLSANARAALREAAALQESRIESHGHYRLKGLAEPAEVFELGLHEGGAFTPPPDAEKAYRVVADGNLWRPLREVRHNLPPERDAFIGRGSELAALARQLDSGTRLITLLGPGGTGKTRLVRRYGLAWLGDWPGGVYFCDLSESRSQEGVLSAVAVGLGVPLGKGDALTQLGHAIAGRARCLVILDNAEQVLEHVPATLGRWLDRATEASFVVTSRERLRLGGEVVFLVEPLPLAGDASDAIELFAARSRAQRPEFVVDAGNRAAVAEVVRLLDGLPLAIELAAARSRVLSPVQLVERMRNRFALLAGARGAAARQATLRAAIDWSWDLLAPWEQAALAQCAVFEGGFTMAAAEGVLDLSPWPVAPPTLDAVQSLLDKSLLRASPQAARERLEIDEPHFGMYVSIHEYARERLHALGAEVASSAGLRHGRHFAVHGRPDRIEALWRHGGVKRRRALALELDNLVAACQRAIARADADVAAATYAAAWEVLEMQGPFAPGIDLGSQVTALAGLAPAARVSACATLGRALQFAGRTEDGIASFELALALARGQGDRRREGSLLNRLGNLNREFGRLDVARQQLQAALISSRATGDRGVEASALGNLAVLDHYEGRQDESRALHEQALAIHREVGNRAVESAVLNNLAVLHHEQGRMEEALLHHRLALEVRREVGDRVSEATSLGNTGNVLIDLGRLDEGEQHQREALAIHREVGNRAFEAVVLGNLAGIRLQQRRADEARADLETALAIAGEVGSRRHEAYLLGSLGDLHRGQGRVELALDCCGQALTRSQALRDRRTQGWVHGVLGKLHLAQGRFDDARETLRQGEALLRGVGEQVELAKLLCTRGQLEQALGERDTALATLAETIAAERALGAGPQSEVGQAVAELRKVLA